MSREFVALEFPAWIRWGQRQGAFLDSPKGLCRWCREAVKPPRQCWCSDVCAGRFIRVSTWNDLRRYVMERDRVCQRCGSEHPGWKRGLGVLRIVYVAANLRGKGYRCEYSMLQEAWDVDHITPVRKGGTDNPENLRLLCAKCHVAVGYEQRAAA